MSSFIVYLHGFILIYPADPIDPIDLD